MMKKIWKRLRMKGYLYHHIGIHRMYKQALGGQKEWADEISQKKNRLKYKSSFFSITLNHYYNLKSNV